MIKMKVNKFSEFFICTLAFVFLAQGCSSGSNNNTADEGELTTSNIESEVPNQSIPSGIYQGSPRGTVELVDLRMDVAGYLDITTYFSSIDLLALDLSPVHSPLSGTALVDAGEYKVKITYDPPSTVTGAATIFSLELMDYLSLPNLVSGYQAPISSLGNHSKYYKLSLPQGGNVDVTNNSSEVSFYNVDNHVNNGIPLVDSYEVVSSNAYLQPGNYLVKIRFGGTQNFPGSATVLF